MPASAFAAKQGSYTPTLSASVQSSAAVSTSSAQNTSYVVSGCGYNAGFGDVTVEVFQPGSVAFAGQPVDANGCISLSNFSTQGAGSYRIDAWQHVAKRDIVVATTSFNLS
jgi:hypothetical protein